jgi:hypothetical protein
MNFDENKTALVWFSEELRKAEGEREHKRIVVEVVDGKCHHAEAAVKTLFKIDK